MKLKVKNLGILKRLEIEPKQLTLLCGGNNTGKTYAMYVLWGLLSHHFEVHLPFVEELTKDLIKNRILEKDICQLYQSSWQNTLHHLEKAIKQYLPRLFSTDRKRFQSTEFEIDLNFDRTMENIFVLSIKHILQTEDKNILLGITKEADTNNISLTLTQPFPYNLLIEQLNQIFINLLFSSYATNVFLLPAERSGLNLFFRELNTRRAALLRHVANDVINLNELVKDIFVSKYPQPIDDYIQFLNSQSDIKRNQSQFAHLAAELQKKVLNVRYKIDRYGDISVLPYRTKEEFGLHLSSSTVKTFFGLWSYLQHRAEKGDCLMIDEPELNLHPDNQRLIARLLAKLVNQGIQVVISTHSDYLVRELNNLIMLKDPFTGREELIRKFGYEEEGGEFLSPEQVAAYHFSARAVEPMPITTEAGIEAETFDEVINSLNESASTIYFTKQDA